MVKARIETAVAAIERDLGPVPMEFSALVERLIDDSRLRADLEALLAAQRAGQELDRGPRIDSISEFLERELERLASVRPERAEKKDWRLLDRTFVEILREINAEALQAQFMLEDIEWGLRRSD